MKRMLRRISNNQKINNLVFLNENGREYFSGSDDIKMNLLKKFTNRRYCDSAKLLEGMKETYKFMRDHDMADGWKYFNLMKDILDPVENPETPCYKRQLEEPPQKRAKKSRFSDPHDVINEQACTRSNIVKRRSASPVETPSKVPKLYVSKSYCNRHSDSKQMLTGQKKCDLLLPNSLNIGRHFADDHTNLLENFADENKSSQLESSMKLKIHVVKIESLFDLSKIQSDSLAADASKLLRLMAPSSKEQVNYHKNTIITSLITLFSQMTIC